MMENLWYNHINNMEQSMKSIAIIIGHKESSPGAVNQNTGVTEFKFNEPLALSISEKLEMEGFKTFTIYRDSYSQLPSKVNQTGADIAVSLHCNAFNTKATGCETLYYHKSKNGKRLAGHLQIEIASVMTTFPDRGIKPKRSEDRGGYLLRETSMPCVIVEPFFIDNDLSLHTAQVRFEELAEAYVTGIKNYFGD